MDLTERDELERAIRAHCEAGDLNRAVEVALRGYGREILEFLIASHRSQDEASEVFSVFAEGVLRSLPRFAWSSSFRTWAYVIARRASSHHHREARRGAAREVAVPDSALSAVAEKVRTETLSWLRTHRRTRLLALRDRLPPDNQALLMLRVDRGLSWNELARVLHDGEVDLDDETLKREAARLRKRFQLVKEKFHEMALREGLIGAKKDG